MGSWHQNWLNCSRPTPLSCPQLTHLCSVVDEVIEAVSSPAQQIFLAQFQEAAVASIYCPDAEG